MFDCDPPLWDIETICPTDSRDLFDEFEALVDAASEAA